MGPWLLDTFTIFLQHTRLLVHVSCISSRQCTRDIPTNLLFIRTGRYIASGVYPTRPQFLLCQRLKPIGATASEFWIFRATFLSSNQQAINSNRLNWSYSIYVQNLTYEPNGSKIFDIPFNLIPGLILNIWYGNLIWKNNRFIVKLSESPWSSSRTLDRWRVHQEDEKGGLQQSFKLAVSFVATVRYRKIVRQAFFNFMPSRLSIIIEVYHRHWLV